MMYNNQLAVAIKTAQGKVLREHGDKVYIPFGSEYSVYIKNLNTVRASVKVSVDGQDVGDGRSFVVAPNGTFDIERFIKNGNLNEGNRLKFIERTGSVEDHRGIGIEDGLIRVEFQFEKQPVLFKEPQIYRDPPPVYPPFDYFGSAGSNSGSLRRGMTKGTSFDSLGMDQVRSYAGTPIADASFDINDSLEGNDAGITVPGSVSDQHFTEVSAFPLEVDSHVIVLKLLGETEHNKVKNPVTVKTKPRCVTCGRVNKANAKFCSNCGTALTIV